MMADEILVHRGPLVGKLDQLLRDRDAHKRGGFHEWPQTCGGCHFYQGAFGALVDLLPTDERRAWWDKWDAAKRTLECTP